MNAGKKQNFRQDIQGLRAVAVIAVMVFHFNPSLLPGGFVGVDIFLVISGFLIASILLRKKSQATYRLMGTLGYFYTSRLKRIVPAYLAMLVVVSLLAAIFFLPEDFKIYKNGLNKALWFNSNNYFASFGDYFAPANHEQPLLHTWSLAIEIQFYFIAPFVFLFLPKQALKWLLPMAIIGLTAYAEYRLRFLGLEQATYYSLIARLPAFFIGALAALYIEKTSLVNNCTDIKYKYIAGVALALILFSFWQPKITGYFPGVAGLIPTIAAAILILFHTNNYITKLLSNSFLVWIGALSYSLYLWHWPVLAFLRYYTGLEVLNIYYSLAFISLTFILSIASYYGIETPLRLRKSTKQIIGYAGLASLVIITAVGIKKINKHYSPPSLPVEYTRYADPSTICHGTMNGDCLKGDLNSEIEVLVLGDSHAAMLNYFFDYLGKELKFKARIITASSCVNIPGFDYQRLAEWAHKACISQIDEANKYLLKAHTIFLAASWNGQLESSLFKNALNDFLTHTNNRQKNVYLISQEPLLKHDPLKNLRFENLGIANNTVINKDYLSANKYLKNQALNYNNVHFIDFSNLKIFDNPPLYNGHLIYYDEHHINEIGAREYAKEALDIFKKINISKPTT